MKSIMASPPFLQMPIHLMSLVLSRLDCMASLASAILSHSSLYAAYDEDRTRIIRSILRNQIPPRLLGYVSPTFQARWLNFDPLSVRQMGGFLSRHFFWRFPFRPEGVCVADTFCARPDGHGLDPQLAGPLSKTHAIVEHFTTKFIMDTLPLARDELCLQRDGGTAISSNEIFRIQRAIYRFELYCNLFRRPYAEQQKPDLGSTIAIRFFNKFAPWVNEQLGCIHDFFERMLSQTFDEVAAHDVEWGAKGVDWLPVSDKNEHKQGYLFLGLEFLFKLDQATTYQERREILYSVGGTPPETRHMLGTTLWKQGLQSMDWEEWYDFWDHDIDATITPDGKRMFVDITWEHNESDGYSSSSFRIWRAAHEDVWRQAWDLRIRQRQQEITYYTLHRRLRRCGYVFWDTSHNLADDAKLKHRILESRKLSLLEWFWWNDAEARRKAKESRRERAEIYKRGGRGYWSEGDSSRIVWTQAVQEHDVQVSEFEQQKHQK